MCGILGLFKLGEQVNEEQFRENLSRLEHRGPDGTDIVKINKFPLNGLIGHTRLAIRGLGEQGAQPMRTDATCISFNGEIYNTEELNSIIVKHGRKVNTSCDTETILIGFEVLGPKIFELLDGIFAIIIYEYNSQTIWLARDFTGVKPLYYSIQPNQIAFGSEVDPVRHLIGLDEISRDSLSFYLQYGYSPPGFTIIKDLLKVNPGQILRIDFGNTVELQTKQIQNKFCASSSLDDPREIRKTLEREVSKQMISEVPVGCFLSGGVDSSIISYLAFLESPNITAFTSEFISSDSYLKFNADLVKARSFAKSLGIKHETIIIDENSEELSSDYFKWASMLDEPQANNTGFSAYLIAKRASEMGIKVLLSGDGADEVFGGYPRYRNAMLIQLAQPILKHMSKYKAYYNDNPMSSYLRNYQLFDNNLFEEIFDGSEIFVPESRHNSNYMSSYFNELDFNWWLPEESNQRLDRATMLCGVEARVPFQSINIVKNHFKKPLWQKVSAFSEKRTLRKAFRDLPCNASSSPKQGWVSPDSKWFRTGLRELVLEYLSPEKLKLLPYVNSKKVSDIVLHRMQGSYFRNELRVLLTYSIWYFETFSKGKR